MASFTAAGIPDPTPNALYSAAGVDDTVNTNQHNALLNAGLSQDLTDRATIRNNAAGLMAGDPTATAAALGANPHLAGSIITSIGTMQGNQRSQALQDLSDSSNLAGAVINAPPDQQAAMWAQGRQRLIDTGHQNVPPEQFPGLPAMHVMRDIGMTALQQLNGQAEYPTTSGQSPWAYPQGSSGAQSGAGGGQAATQGQGSSAFSGSGGGQAAAGGGSIAGPLAQSESGGNPAAENKEGYAGLYGFGTARLNSLGMYQPAAGENLKSNQWSGTLSIPGFPQVKTLADFKANPAAQQAAYQAHEGDIRQAIAATPGAQDMDQGGLIAVAHLGGIQGMQQFVASGGRYNPADSNGTRLSSYYKKFSGVAPGQSAGGQPVAAPDATPGGFGGGSAAPGGPAAPVQVASAAGTNGMPATATDASPNAYSGAGPAQPSPAAQNAPAYRPGAAVNAGTAATLNRLVQPATPATPATSVSPVVGSSGTNAPSPAGQSAAQSAPPSSGVSPSPATTAIRAAAGQPVPLSAAAVSGGVSRGTQGGAQQQAPMSAQDAVAQASAELGDRLLIMSPADGNAAVQARAQELMGSGSGTQAGSGQPAPLPSTPAQPQTLPGGFQGASANALASAAPAVSLPTPAGGGGQRSNLLSSAAPGALTTPNALLPATQTQPAVTPQPPAPTAPLPGAPGPNAYPLYWKGALKEFPGKPSFVVGYDPDANNGRGGQVPIPSGSPQLKFEKQGNDLVGLNPYTGAVGARIEGPNTGRLTAVPDGKGGLTYIGPTGQPVAQGGNTLGLDLAKQDYQRDQQMVPEAASDLAQLRQQEFTLRDARDVSQGLQQTGFFGAGKAQAASLISSTLGPDAAKAVQGVLGLDDPSASEQFNKLMFQAASSQENANVGARGGFNLTKAYAAANPGLQSQPQTVRDILNVQSVANAMHSDYTQGLLNHVAQQSQALHSGGSYQPSSVYQAQWANSTQPRIYLAAAEALNQKPYATWGSGLSPQEQQQALAIAGRVNNTASYQGPQGPAALTPYGAPGGGQGRGGAQASGAPAAPSGPSGAGPAVGTVSRGYRFNGGDPSLSASWSRVQ